MCLAVMLPGARMDSPSPREEERTLHDADVPEIVEQMFEVRNKSERLGRALELPKDIVESITRGRDTDTGNQLFQIIDEFVRQVAPRPTWSVIVEALRKPTVWNHRLAREIEKKYCPGKNCPSLPSILLHAICLDQEQ